MMALLGPKAATECKEDPMERAPMDQEEGGRDMRELMGHCSNCNGGDGAIRSDYQSNYNECEFVDYTGNPGEPGTTGHSAAGGALATNQHCGTECYKVNGTPVPGDGLPGEDGTDASCGQGRFCL